jgi:hypothetical protein
MNLPLSTGSHIEIPTYNAQEPNAHFDVPIKPGNFSANLLTFMYLFNLLLEMWIEVMAYAPVDGHIVAMRVCAYVRLVTNLTSNAQQTGLFFVLAFV